VFLKVEVLVVLQNEHCFSWRSAPEVEPLLYDDSPPSSRELADHLNNCASLYSSSSVARSSVATTAENSSGRKSLPDSLLQNSNLGSSSLRRQFRQEQDCSLAQKLQKPIDDDKYKDVDDCSELPSITNQKPRNDTHQTPDAEAKARKLGRSSSDINHHHDVRITNLIRRNMALEEQLSAALTTKDEAEKNLSLVIDSKDELEKRLAERDREVEALKEKVTGMELAQEESNNLSNTVHAENVRLEREVAFLKAVMDETQKAREQASHCDSMYCCNSDDWFHLFSGTAFNSWSSSRRTCKGIPAPGKRLLMQECHYWRSHGLSKFATCLAVAFFCRVTLN